MKTIVRLVQTTNKSDHMIVCMDDISTCVGCRITPTGSPKLDCIDNNQSSRQTIHHLRVLLLCARAVPAVRVCTCPVHACAHYTMWLMDPVGLVAVPVHQCSSSLRVVLMGGRDVLLASGKTFSVL